MGRRKWMSIAAAARELDLSQRTVRRLIEDGALAAAKMRGSLKIWSRSVNHYHMVIMARYLRDTGIELSPDLAREIQKESEEESEDS